MNKFVLPMLSALALAAPAVAKDSRIASRLYRNDEVVRIDGQLGVQASVAFAEDEHIENVAVGDSASWQITPNKRANMLFVKPLSPKARTNMTVITDRRTYFFDLIASPAASPLYVLRFTYPDEPKPPVLQAAAPAPALSEAESRIASGEKPVDPATLNFTWTKRGDAKLHPVRLFDDGQATYVTWAPGATLPAILIRDERGAEGPVNYAVRGDTIVIEGVPSPIYLRAGKSSAQLENRAPPRKPAPATTFAADTTKGL